MNLRHRWRLYLRGFVFGYVYVSNCEYTLSLYPSVRFEVVLSTNCDGMICDSLNIFISHFFAENLLPPHCAVEMLRPIEAKMAAAAEAKPTISNVECNVSLFPPLPDREKAKRARLRNEAKTQKEAERIAKGERSWGKNAHLNPRYSAGKIRENLSISSIEFTDANPDRVVKDDF